MSTQRVGSILRILGLGILLLVMAVFIRAWVNRQPPASEEQQQPAFTPAQVEETLPSPGPQTPNLGPPGNTPLPYPGPPTPAPTPEPTATLHPVANLPQINTYKDLPEPKGMMVMYSRADDPGIYIANVDSSDELQLPVWPEDQWNGLNTNLFRASPRGDKILYRLWPDMEVDKSAIWLMNLDGSGKQLLLSAVPKEWAIADAVWAPDGSEIIYLRMYFHEEGGLRLLSKQQELWAITPDGKQERKISEFQNMHIPIIGGHAAYLEWMLNGYIYAVDENGILTAIDPIRGNSYELMRNVDPIHLSEQLSPSGDWLATSPLQLAEEARQAGFPAIETQGYVLAVGLNLTDGYVTRQSGDAAAGIWLNDPLTGKKIHMSVDEPISVIGYSPGGRFLGAVTGHNLIVYDLFLGEEYSIQVKQPPNINAPSLTFIDWIPIR